MDKNEQQPAADAPNPDDKDLVIPGSDNELIEVGDGEGVTLVTEMPKKEDVPPPDGAQKPADEVAAKPEEQAAAKPQEQRQKPKKSAQERINEISRERYEATERAAAAETALELAREELTKLRSGAIASDEKSIDAKAREAIDRGDMPAYHAAMQELVDLRVRKAVTAQAPEKKSTEDRQPTPRPQPVREAMEDLGGGYMVPANTAPDAKAWLKENAWYRDQKNRHLGVEAERIEQRLFQKYGSYSKQLFDELDAELDQLPEFDAVRGRAEPEPPAAQPTPPVQQQPAQQRPPMPPRPTVAPPAPTGGSQEQPQGKQLTEHDKKQMKLYGLDPNEKRHREAYLRRKS